MTSKWKETEYLIMRRCLVTSVACLKQIVTCAVYVSLFMFIFMFVCLFVVQNVMMVILVSWMVQWLVKDVWSIAREDDGEQCAMATGDHLRLLWYADKMDFPLMVCVCLCMDVYSAYMYVS